MGRFVDL